MKLNMFFFFFSSRRRHTRSTRDWSSDVCSSDLGDAAVPPVSRAIATAGAHGASSRGGDGRGAEVIRQAPDAQAASPLFGVRGFTVRFGERTALRDVTLEVPAGHVTAVVGGDGAGKTTLLRVLAGALTRRAGEVRRPTPAQTGYLSASSGTYPDLSVEENLAFSAVGYGLPAARARERSSELLERTGLDSARRRLAGQLSGGMRQKLGVIRAMVHEPALLVLDEPTTGVDPVSRADLWWLIARAAAAGAAVVLGDTPPRGGSGFRPVRTPPRPLPGRSPDLTCRTP